MRDYSMSHTEHTFDDSYAQAVINSALWAAYGDALGWITELAPNINNVKYRTGKEYITETMNWRRNISGRNGPSVNLPAGTYSDDTQLRLAVSRSIRGDGFFDVESFAKIELPVWQSYALGAGIGSKIAASNLAKKSVNWFTNFYNTSRPLASYTNGGGNGAAMRIQPHVWACRSKDKMILNVFKDSITTHGHVHGFCGAVFHALCLHKTLEKKLIPNFQDCKQILEGMKNLYNLILNDTQLATFWLPTWEDKTGYTIQQAINQILEEMLKDLEKISTSTSLSYFTLLNILGCNTDKFRGSGFKTALAATIFAHISSSQEAPISIEETLIHISNEIGTDTDTIGTMVGALLGCLCSYEPQGQLQDRNYIITEAKRLVKIAKGHDTISFNYPDLTSWHAPLNQNSSIILKNNKLFLIGLGELKVTGERYNYGNFSWQWFELPFGQTILAKFKSDINTQNINQPNQIDLDLNAQEKNIYTKILNLDEMTDHIIKSNFDNELIGYYINFIIDSSKSLELVVSFSAIIAKAKIARIRKNRI